MSATVANAAALHSAVSSLPFGGMRMGPAWEANAYKPAKQVIGEYMAKHRTMSATGLAKKIFEENAPRWKNFHSIKGSIRFRRGTIHQNGRICSDKTFFPTKAEQVAIVAAGKEAMRANGKKHRWGCVSALGLEAECVIIRYPKLSDYQAAGMLVRQNISHFTRSEEHTSELQSLRHLVCRLLLEKKKKKTE